MLSVVHLHSAECSRRRACPMGKAGSVHANAGGEKSPAGAGRRGGTLLAQRGVIGARASPLAPSAPPAGGVARWLACLRGRCLTRLPITLRYALAPPGKRRAPPSALSPLTCTALCESGWVQARPHVGDLPLGLGYMSRTSVVRAVGPAGARRGASAGNGPGAEVRRSRCRLATPPAPTGLRSR